MKPIEKCALDVLVALKGRVSFTALEQFSRQKGYVVMLFGDGGTGDDLLRNLGRVRDMAQTQSGITYCDERGMRFIFINSKLLGNEKLLALAHEIGHIVLNHCTDQGIIGGDKMSNQAADTFAAALLSFSYRRYLFHKWKVPSLVCGMIALVLAGGFIVIQTIQWGRPAFVTTQSDSASTAWPAYENTTVYITPSGTAFHLFEDCFHIKNRTFAKMSYQEAESFRRTLCDDCRIRAQQNSN